MVETKAFVRDAKGIWSEAEYLGLRDHLVSHPDVGVIIPGTHGLRKLRWHAGSKGKRGGARLIYYWRTEVGTVLLLRAFTKSDVDDLSRAELRALGRSVRKLTVEDP